MRLKSKIGIVTGHTNYGIALCYRFHKKTNLDITLLLLLLLKINTTITIVSFGF